MPRATNQIAFTWSIKDKFLKQMQIYKLLVRGGPCRYQFILYIITPLRSVGEVACSYSPAEPEGALRQHAGSRYKLVPGHHAVDLINGFSACSRARSAQSAPAKTSALIS
jgi:hypothetical protein